MKRGSAGAGVSSEVRHTGAREASGGGEWICNQVAASARNILWAGVTVAELRASTDSVETAQQSIPLWDVKTAEGMLLAEVWQQRSLVSAWEAWSSWCEHSHR